MGRVPTAPFLPAELPRPCGCRMAFRSLVRSRLVLLALVLVLAAAGVGGFFLWQHFRLPRPGSPRYDAYVEAFEVGTAALDVGKPDTPEAMTRAIEIIPQE